MTLRKEQGHVKSEQCALCLFFERHYTFEVLWILQTSKVVLFALVPCFKKNFFAFDTMCNFPSYLKSRSVSGARGLIDESC